MPSLRHIALATKDPEATASFYRQAFGFEEVGRLDVDLGEGIFLTDGTLNLAVIRFKIDQVGCGLDYVGIHHFGVLCEDLEGQSAKVEKMGAECVVEKPKDAEGFFEVKYRGPDGVIFDLTDHPWWGSAPLNSPG